MNANSLLSAPFVTIYAPNGMYCSLKQNNMKKTLKILEITGMILLLVLWAYCCVKIYKIIALWGLIC